jgi:hypothetical protein
LYRNHLAVPPDCPKGRSWLSVSIIGTDPLRRPGKLTEALVHFKRPVTSLDRPVARRDREPPSSSPWGCRLAGSRPPPLEERGRPPRKQAYSSGSSHLVSANLRTRV